MEQDLPLANEEPRTKNQERGRDATTSIMVMAGEVSGDMHAAGVVKALKPMIPNVTFFGIGGDALRAEGMELFHTVDDMAVMGLSEVLRRFRFFKRVFHEMVDLAAERKPDAVLLVDYPGFNLRFAERLHTMGIPVIYYICPQVWAWNRKRIPAMARIVDRLITIFPFEKDHFSDTNLRVDFAGHPLVDETREALAGPEPDMPWAGEPRIALLPGSRPHEIDRILPAMWSATEWIQQTHPNASFIIPVPTDNEREFVEEKIEYLPDGPKRYQVVTGQTRPVLRTARAALVASGTATIEAALMRCPMVVTYRVSALTYWLGKLLIKVDHIGMVNIVAGKRACPEFVQGDATPDVLAKALEPLLTDSPEREAMLKDLDRVREKLGPGGSARQAAQSIADELRVAQR